MQAGERRIRAPARFTRSTAFVREPRGYLGFRRCRLAAENVVAIEVGGGSDPFLQLAHGMRHIATEYLRIARRKFASAALRSWDPDIRLSKYSAFDRETLIEFFSHACVRVAVNATTTKGHEDDGDGNGIGVHQPAGVGGAMADQPEDARTLAVDRWRASLREARRAGRLSVG